jgi:NitT/TauT family transport system substrate-binding protein
MPHGRQGSSRSLKAAALAGSVSLALAACGGGGDDADAGAAGGGESPAGGSGPAEVVTVDVGVIPVVDVAVLYLGQEQGIFEDRGITLTFNTGQGGAALVPSVLNGENDFAFSNVISIMQAREQGLPLTIIAPSAASTGEEDFGINMLMAIDPAVQDAGDLVGRNVGVNTLNNLSEVLLRVSVEAAGGDPEQVRLIELPFPDQVNALVSGDLDAFVCAEPFCSTAAAQGARVIANPYHDLAPGEQVTASVYFTTEQAIAEDPELFKNLQEAIQESQTYAAEHPDEVKAQLPNFTRLDPQLIESLRLPEFKPTLEPEELGPMADQAVKAGILKEEPVLDEVVWVADK